MAMIGNIPYFQDTHYFDTTTHLRADSPQIPRPTLLEVARSSLLPSTTVAGQTWLAGKSWEIPKNQWRLKHGNIPESGGFPSHV